MEAVREKVENIEKLKREKMREEGHRNAAENAVRAREWHKKVLSSANKMVGDDWCTKS